MVRPLRVASIYPLCLATLRWQDRRGSENSRFLGFPKHYFQHFGVFVYATLYYKFLKFKYTKYLYIPKFQCKNSVLPI